LKKVADILSFDDMAELAEGALGTLLVITDANGAIVSCNTAFQELAGKPSSEIAGRALSALMDQEKGRLSGIAWAEREIKGRAAQRYRLHLGTLDGAHAALVARLTEREAVLRSIIDTVPSALITIDKKGVIQFFSPSAERMFGCSATEMVGQKIDRLMPEPYRAEHDQYIERYLKTGEKRIIGIGRVVMAQRKDGSTFPVELAVGEVKTDTAHFFLGSVRDITARAEAEREIHQLQTQLLQSSRLSALGEMASAMAHELNQPISAIMSYVDAAQHLLNTAGAQAQVRLPDMLAKAAAQSRRAGQIVHHLRHFVLTGETEKSEADVNIIVQDALAMALVGASQKDAAIKLELGKTLPKALVDRVQIQQVLVNLLRNGLDATAEVKSPTLTITTRRRDDGYVEVAVSDNGPGIDPEITDRLFHPFVTTKPKGMGIGLSICRSIIDSHGGRIWASNGSSGGALFAFTLPIAEASDERGL
jgi:two-component system sensor kinase FixL